MKKFILLLMLTGIFINSALGQGAVSGNGFFVASIMKDGGQQKIFIHKFMTKELVRKLSFNPPIVSGKITKVKYDFGGQLLGVFQNNNLYVFDAMADKQIALITNAKDILFSYDSDFFVVWKNNSIIKYSAEGKQLLTYYVPSGKTVKEIKLSPNNKYITILTQDNRAYFYPVDQARYKKELAANDVKFSTNGKYFTILYIYGEKARASVYKTENFYKDRALSSESLLKPYGIGTAGKPKLLAQRTTLNPDGTFISLYTAKGFQVEIYIFNIYSKKLVWKINNLKNTSNELFPINWTAQNIMIAHGANMMAGEYNVIGHASKSLFLRIDPLNGNNELSEENQKENLILSPDYHLAVLQGSKGLYVRDTRIPNQKFFFENVRFLSFSPNAKYMFVEKDGVVTVLVNAQISKALSQGLTAKFYPLDKNLKTSVPEKYQPDAKPPKGYAYFLVDNTKQVVKVDTAKLHLVLRSVDIKDNDVEIKVNLVDNHGNIFLGASDPSWKYMWCNLILQDPSMNVRQIKDFVVEEKNVNIPTAYALVLDHSGSMGIKRANSLQFGALTFINREIGKNAFMLIKYDSKAKVEVPLTKEKYLFQRKLANTGLAGYGGNTALIDAAYLAVRKLAKDTKYRRKVVILFTDGYENASFYTKDALLYEAEKNNIEIDVIGFGDDVNEEFLQSIAYNTGGLYEHIYNTKDLKNIFRNVDLKGKHYYSIKFKTTAKGKHVALLQLCQDFGKHDSLWIAFDTKAPTKPLKERNVILPVKKQHIKIGLFKPLLVPPKPNMKPVTSKKVLKDFNNINFPNILFETGSDKILKSDEDGINEIVSFMKKYPYIYLEIDGHTDNIGTPDFNMDLSKRRAEAAKRLIVEKGIAPARIITKGFGETKPIASNDTEEGRKLNRRIEFKVFVY